jgi:hypothetical protein
MLGIEHNKVWAEQGMARPTFLERAVGNSRDSKWQQVAASGSMGQQVAASGSKRQQAAAWGSKWQQVAQSGNKGLRGMMYGNKGQQGWLKTEWTMLGG